MARTGRGSPIEERVRALAHRFADEVALALRQEMDHQVAARVLAVVKSATRTDGRRLSLGGGPADRRIGKPPVPVVCPVKGCCGEGLRAKHNFCAAHAGQLTDGEKRRIRTAQQARPTAASRAPVKPGPARR
ncbi:MAG: hypothetical protein EXR72_26810 [Myxococcales bacterium]|nr:hypothetical protein [Myxococcales bacterium]